MADPASGRRCSKVGESDRTRLRTLELGNQEIGTAGVLAVFMAGVDEVDLVAFNVELIFERRAEYGGMGGRPG
jgi:hypothetical protein